MGFSLKSFIEELERILIDPDISNETKIVRMEEAVRANKMYADECGQLS